MGKLDAFLGGIGKKKQEEDPLGLRADYKEQIGEGDITEEIGTEVEGDNPLAIENDNYVSGDDEEKLIPEHPGSLN